MNVAAKGTAVRIYVDVVSPGKGLVTCGEGDFSGSIVRVGGRGRFYVETEWGRVIGRADSYRDGAALMARHEGYQLGVLVLEHEWRVTGETRY